VQQHPAARVDAQRSERFGVHERQQREFLEHLHLPLRPGQGLPPARQRLLPAEPAAAAAAPDVAVQAAFEKANFVKTGFSLHRLKG
jgi:hypothetical protein